MQLILASQSEGRKKLLSLLKIPFKVFPSTLDEDKIVASSPIETIKLRAKLKGEDVTIRIQNSVISNQKKLKTDNRLLTTNNYQLITNNQYLILSADSGAILNNQLLGKPKDYNDAVRILKTLSGSTHTFVTAIYVIKLEWEEESRIMNHELRGYLESNQDTSGVAALGLSKGMTPPMVEEPEKNRIRKLKSEKLATEDLPTPKIVKIWQEVDTSHVTFRKLSNEAIKLYLSLTNYKRYAGTYALFATPQDFITKIDGSLSNVIGLPLEKVIPILKENKLL